ncbi:MAG: type I-E CRISPR-associated protein Cas6/Cse3/CasE [Pelolinea sp.]|nr:type I-E CRISPR-associated protein Cas6/Cse3/CasE [Pelolinea sp.]
MYLSKLLLNKNCAQARADLGNPYNMHRTIMRSFPTPLSEDERVLFRIEYAISGENAVVLVQSMEEPNWEKVEKLHNDYFAQEPMSRSLKTLKFKNGDLFRFRMRVTISKRVVYKNSGKSQRISLFSEQDRIEWLNRKAKNGGFSLMGERLVVRDAPYRNFLIKRENENFRATLNMVDVDGQLTVEDGEKFLECFMQGIGPAKGLGCGLVSLAK